MRSPQVFDRPLRGPVSGDQMAVRVRFGARRRIQLVQRIDGAASRARGSLSTAYDRDSASLTWPTAGRVNEAGR